MTLKEVEDLIDKSYEEEKPIDSFIIWYNEMWSKLKREHGHENIHRSRIISFLFNEALPMSIYLENNQGRYCKIQLKRGNQNYDGIITDNQNLKSYVEITTAQDGELKLYTLKHLEKFHSAPISGVKTEEIYSALNNNKEAYVDTPEECVVDAEEEVDKLAEKINARIGSKVSKKYEPKTILIVAFDELPICNEALFDRLLKKITTHHGQKTFKEIVLVGFRGKRCVTLI